MPILSNQENVTKAFMEYVVWVNGRQFAVKIVNVLRKSILYIKATMVSVCDRVVRSAQPCHRFYGRIGWAVPGRKISKKEN
jgi:hypothetical protein